MNTNKLFPFMIRQTISDETKIDTAIEPGYYTLYQLASTTYCPVQYGELEVYRSSSCVSQVVNSHKSKERYFRVNWNTEGWSAWQRLDNFGYNSLAELANGVAGQIGLSNQTFVIPVNGIVKVSSNICGLFVFRIGTYSAVVNFSNWIRTDGVVVSGDFSVTKDTDGKCNIYSENSALYLQNLTDTEVTVKSVAIGL